MRKPVFGLNDNVLHRPGCIATKDGLRFEISDLGSGGGGGGGGVTVLSM